MITEDDKVFVIKAMKMENAVYGDVWRCKRDIC